MKVAVVGGSGYVGGELVRMLLGHPGVELAQVTSDHLAGTPVARAHPNLRKRTTLAFIRRQALAPADVVFVAVPHGEAVGLVPDLLSTGGTVIDLSADFRLSDPSLYPVYYRREHPRPDLLASRAYGLPELHRDRIRSASLISVPGCIATASILALAPMRGVPDLELQRVVIDSKSGSSASGADQGPSGHHAERSGVMRAYAPAGHRHTAEIEQETGARVGLSCHSVEAVRGVLATVHLPTRREIDEKELWGIYRRAYGSEPFVRIVHETQGIYRAPEPKLLAGTNYCDVGFAVDPHAERVVLLGALDNLGKGAAGAAVQCLNVRAGFPETTGLDFPGLHPV